MWSNSPRTADHQTQIIGRRSMVNVWYPSSVGTGTPPEGREGEAPLNHSPAGSTVSDDGRFVASGPRDGSAGGRKAKPPVAYRADGFAVCLVETESFVFSRAGHHCALSSRYARLSTIPRSDYRLGLHFSLGLNRRFRIHARLDCQRVRDRSGIRSELVCNERLPGVRHYANGCGECPCDTCRGGTGILARTVDASFEPHS